MYCGKLHSCKGLQRQSCFTYSRITFLKIQFYRLDQYNPTLGRYVLPLECPISNPLPRPATSLHVRCSACQDVLSHVFYPGQIPLSSHFAVGSGQSTPSSGHKSSRQSWSSAAPGYCDILGVPVNATMDDIKKAYSGHLLSFSFPSAGRLAIKLPTRTQTIRMQKKDSRRLRLLIRR